jgi:hypothetical protein
MAEKRTKAFAEDRSKFPRGARFTIARVPSFEGRGKSRLRVERPLGRAFAVGKASALPRSAARSRVTP